MYSGLVILSMVVVWVVDMDRIQKVTLEYSDMKVELNKTTERAQQAAKEVAVTATKFNKTINSFLAFNLADFQREGRLNLTIAWEDAAKFVQDAADMSAEVAEHDIELNILLYKSKAKVLELFVFENKDIFTEISDGIKKYIESGLKFHDGKLQFFYDQVDVNFDELKRLTNNLDESKQNAWRIQIRRLESFYQRNFSKSDTKVTLM